MSDFEFADNKPKRGRPAKQEEQVVEPQLEETKEDEKKDDSVEKKVVYDKDELLRIFDDIIFSGEYLEEVSIRGKLKVQFRTRTAEEISEISRILDSSAYNLVSTMQESRFLLNLQYALTEYQGRTLIGQKIEDRAKFVRKLPGPIIGMLVNALMDFDNKVAEACKDVEADF
jgi:hypothetical protein